MAKFINSQKKNPSNFTLQKKTVWYLSFFFFGDSGRDYELACVQIFVQTCHCQTQTTTTLCVKLKIPVCTVRCQRNHKLTKVHRRRRRTSGK